MKTVLPLLIGHYVGGRWELYHRSGEGVETRYESRVGQPIVSSVESLVQQAQANGLRASLMEQRAGVEL